MKQVSMDDVGGSGAKKHAPATLRNREAIAAVLDKELPQSGVVLEVASGTGEHAAYLAGRFPMLDWLPTDRGDDALASISAYRAEYEGRNLLEPVRLDAALADWRVPQIDAILCINMVHISPWAATNGLFKEAAKRLAQAAPLILYGPYFEDGNAPAPSNIEFDLSLRARNDEWGIRGIEDMDELAAREGFTRTARHEMPANNLMLVYRCA